MQTVKQQQDVTPNESNPSTLPLQKKRELLKSLLPYNSTTMLPSFSISHNDLLSPSKKHKSGNLIVKHQPST